MGSNNQNSEKVHNRIRTYRNLFVDMFNVQSFYLIQFQLLFLFNSLHMLFTLQ